MNDRSLDKNYGGILIVWDRLFGSFAEEDDAEPCVNGTRSPLRSFNPLWANLQAYRGTGAAAAAVALFLAVLGGTSAFLWVAHELSPAEQALSVAGLVAALWVIGALTQPRRQTADAPWLAAQR